MMKMNTVKHSVAAVVKITMQMSFGSAVMFVKGGSMESALRLHLLKLRALSSTNAHLAA